MFCVNCGNKLDDDAVFCTNCGKKLTADVSKEEIRFCINCGSKLDEDSAFCSNCGKKIEFNGVFSTETIPDSSKIEATQEKTENDIPIIAASENSCEDNPKTIEEMKTGENIQLGALETKTSPLVNFANDKTIEEKAVATKIDKMEDTSEVTYQKSEVPNDKNEQLISDAQVSKKGSTKQDIPNKAESIKENIPKTSTEEKGSSTFAIVLIIGFILSLILAFFIETSKNTKNNNSAAEYNTGLKVGDVIQENGTPIAVIFKKASGGQPALGVALRQSDSLQWASCHYDFEPGYSKTTVSQGYDKSIRGLQNLTDGHDGYKILCNSVNDWQKKGSYPAFEYAENYSAGSFTDWYLPTANELYFLYINLEKVNQSLMQCGGKKIKIVPGNIFYWTCNQVENTSWAAVCTDFCYSIDSSRQNVGGCNQKGGGFTVLPIHRVYEK
ncbi:zinc-ribbon domain-containing protein [uncultured Treponema sp.]|uniref:zinc-ribbon domain-containing protein n=1 Tax=uncultured Treponema sp. TaxID=162155 RepID=UPI0025E72A2F|nr:zinc-ribbon domain-containing protein [uncultured Treponema sp.]